MRLLLPALALYLLANAAGAAEPVTVLGLPLGGKITPSVKNCTSAAPKRNAPICWIVSNKDYEEFTFGSLHIPESAALPAWAASATFEANVDRTGVLIMFTVESGERYEPRTIVDSISARFGSPAFSGPVGLFKAHARWERPEIEISMLCEAKRCFTHFRSGAEAAEGRRRGEEAVKREAARPLTP